MGEGSIGDRMVGVKALLKHLAVALLVSMVLLPVRPQPSAAPTVEPGTLTVDRGWVRLAVSGTPYEMGFQQGRLLRPYLRGLIATRLYPALQRGKVDIRAAHRYARHSWERLPEPLAMELRGIAEGADVALEELWLWNLRAELLTLGERLPALLEGAPSLSHVARTPLGAGGGALAPPAGVRGEPAAQWPASLPPIWEVPEGAEGLEQDGSLLAAWGEGSSEGVPWLAATLPRPPGGEHLLLILRRPAGELPFVALALPGQVGVLAGINARKVNLLGASFPTVDRSIDGLPLPLLLRQALGQSRTTDEALRSLVDAERAGGGTVLIADGSGEGPLRLELSARQLRRLDPDGGVLLALGPPLEGPLAATARSLPMEEDPRRGRLAVWLRANRGFITGASIRQLLAEPGASGSYSPAALVLAPTRSELWLAGAAEGRGAPASGWTDFDLQAWWAEGEE